MSYRIRALCFATTLLSAACARKAVDTTDIDQGFAPIDVIVIETEGLLLGIDERIPILVQVPRPQEHSKLGRFEKNGRIRLELGSDARIVRSVRGRGRSAMIRDIRKGDRLRVSGYDQALLSDPAIIFPSMILIEGTNF